MKLMFITKAPMIEKSFKLEKESLGLGQENLGRVAYFIRLMDTIKGLGVNLDFMILSIEAYYGQ